jgi:hypothetical protein
MTTIPHQKPLILRGPLFQKKHVQFHFWLSKINYLNPFGKFGIAQSSMVRFENSVKCFTLFVTITN